jgi:CheY-like chemotaxis protein
MPVAPTTVPGLRVLLVDDSMAILKVTGRALEQAGHTVETASNGSRALDRLLKCFKSEGAMEMAPSAVCVKDFDFMLIDLQMPVMDGFECVRRFRAVESEIHSKFLQLQDTESTTRGTMDVFDLQHVAVAALNDDELSSKSKEAHLSDCGGLNTGGSTSTRATAPSTSISTSTSTSTGISSRQLMPDEGTVTTVTGASALHVTAIPPPVGEVGVGGIEAGKLRRLPIIGMSANSDDVSKELALSSGMDAFIAKPFSLKDLQPLLLRFVVASMAAGSNSET